MISRSLLVEDFHYWKQLVIFIKKLIEKLYARPIK